MSTRLATISALAFAFYILVSTLLFGQLREIGVIHTQTLIAQPAYHIDPTPHVIPPLPIAESGQLPVFSSTHWEILDLGSGVVVASENAQNKVAIASLTKLMTAYLVRKNDSLSSLVTVKPEDIAINSEDSSMGLVAGERITVGDLLKGLLIPSGDDAALVLARYTSGSATSFVAQMNAQAAALGLSSTHFANPSGLDQTGHYSTASDLSQLARLVISDPVLKEIVGTRYDSVRADTGQFHALYNTNTLLGQDGISGIKTGHTNEAGDCLISLETVDGHEIITTLLGSSDRFGETEALVNWSRQNISW